MLGEDIWKETQNKIMEILTTDQDSVIYHFISEELSEIRSIVIHENKSDDDLSAPLFVQRLQELSVLKLQIDHQNECVAPIIGDA
jgi:hypothetical protein